MFLSDTSLPISSLDLLMEAFSLFKPLVSCALSFVCIALAGHALRSRDAWSAYALRISALKPSEKFITETQKYAHNPLNAHVEDNVDKSRWVNMDELHAFVCFAWLRRTDM